MENEKTKEVTQEATQAAPSLTLDDLVAIANVINAASTRGAFKANELTSVGAVYDKLNAFVTAATKAQQSQEVPSEKAADTVENA